MTSPRPPAPRGVRLAGTGHYLPSRVITNKDLESWMDTSDEWIVQRTGIHERRRIDREKGETTTSISAAALTRALENARMKPTDLDMLLVATVSMEMTCPSTACRVAEAVGAGTCGAVDLSAACCGFVYATNFAHELVKGGAYRTVGVVGVDVLTPLMDYCTEGRGTAILFGDAAGAAIYTATDDPSKGIIAQAMHSDGHGWKHLYIPREPRDFPEDADPGRRKLGLMYMNGREVYKFAVTKFQDLIAQTLDKAGLRAEDIDQFVCHQSNARILEAARERFGIPHEKFYTNIGRVGNTSAGSVPVCLDELRRAGRIHDGQKVLLVAFGGGLTWASSLWQL